MLLRDADPDAYNRALANATGRNGAPGPIQPLVLTALITLADEHAVITAEQIDQIPGMTAQREKAVLTALGKLTKQGWIHHAEYGGVRLTGVLEQP